MLQQVAQADTRNRTGVINFREPEVRPRPGRATVHHHWGIRPLSLEIAPRKTLYEEFHPYGTSAYRAFQSSEVSAKRYRYTGKERDEETKLYYYGARYYACWLGRWMSPDPKGLVDGPGLYNYVRGSPVVLSDPSGTDALSEQQRATLEQTAQMLPGIGEGGAETFFGGKAGRRQRAVTPAEQQVEQPIASGEGASIGGPAGVGQPAEKAPKILPAGEDPALDIQYGRQGAAKDWRAVNLEGTDVQGRPQWTETPEGWRVNEYMKPLVGTSHVEVALATGGVLRGLGAVGRAIFGRGAGQAAAAEATAGAETSTVLHESELGRIPKAGPGEDVVVLGPYTRRTQHTLPGGRTVKAIEETLETVLQPAATRIGGRTLEGYPPEMSHLGPQIEKADRIIFVTAKGRFGPLTQQEMDLIQSSSKLRSRSTFVYGAIR